MGESERGKEGGRERRRGKVGEGERGRRGKKEEE